MSGFVEVSILYDAQEALILPKAGGGPEESGPFNLALGLARRVAMRNRAQMVMSRGKEGRISIRILFLPAE